MLDKQLVYDVLTAALATGGDLAEIFMENTASDNINLTNGQVEKAIWGIEYGLGLRVIFGTNCVYAYTNNTSRESLLQLAKDSAAAVKAQIKGDAPHNSVIMLDKTERLKFADKVIIPPEKVGKKAIVEALHIGANAAKEYDPLVTQTTGTYAHRDQNVFIANSNGLWAEDRRVSTRVSITAVASIGNEKQTGSEGPGAKGGFENIENTDMKQLGVNAAITAVTMIKAQQCQGGTMPVIIGNGFGGVLFHEACGHSLEATSVAKGASEFGADPTGKQPGFYNRIGEQIADPCVNAIDDGTLEGEWGSLNIDDEGGKPRRNVLIENGVLKSYLVDYLGGLKMNMPSTGSGRRQNYKYAPTSRMNNTYILPGEHSLDDIIANTEKGLFAKKMGGGSVNPATGEFNFSVREGYMIENGKITEPVRGATLIGKGGQVLKNIDMVGNDFDYGPGICGSQSGGVPTNCGQPAVRVKEMIVGGAK